MSMRGLTPMAKPIEPGCRAVIVNSHMGDNGTIVTVIKYAGPAGFNNWVKDSGPVWIIDTPSRNLLGESYEIAELFLQRIDDEDDSRDISSWDKLIDIYQPPEKVTSHD